MIRYLAESKHYKVYSIYENVYLKNKLDSKSVNEYDDKDLFIAWHYGDPCDAIILLNEKVVVVSGCGLTIYNLESLLSGKLFYYSIKNQQYQSFRCEFQLVGFQFGFTGFELEG